MTDSQRNHRGRWRSRFAACCTALLFGLGGAVRYYAKQMPDHFYAENDAPVSVSAALPLTVSPAEGNAAELRLFGVIPVKQVTRTTVPAEAVYLGGAPFGIRMLMAGAMVVSLADVPSGAGNLCPAERAGIEVGDVIRSVNGVPVTDNAAIQQTVAASEGKPVTVSLTRDSTALTLVVQPVLSSVTHRWQTGMWVRDSTAGIGTVTYYTLSETGAAGFAGLGHAVCDADTGEQIPLGSGDVIPVRVTEVIPGTAGKPGELRGIFDPERSIGTLLANTACGIFGSLDALPPDAQPVKVAYSQDIRRGEAYLYTTLHGETPSAYTVEIEELRRNDTAFRDLVIRVTDETLLAETGGIVQGMSGSPIMQDGKLVGAVTHVFVKDPTRGYGIFAEHMQSACAG